MIPVVDDELLTLEDETQPSLTYALDAENGRIRGKVDGLEAVKQAVYLVLSTERFAHLIYSWNYGAAVDNFKFETKKNAVHVIFTVHSVFGETEVTTDVRR